MNGMEKSHKKKLIIPMAAAAIGVAAGVAAVALSREENRKKVGKALKDLKNKGKDLWEETKEKTDEMKEEAEMPR